MQELISTIHSVQLDSAQPTDITRLLSKYQTEINAQFFNNYSREDIETAFKEILKFFLYAAAHSSSSVRLSAYRATGAFLLKLSPYFTYLVQKTFSDLSMIATIDIKSSAIIASSFAFISKRISLPYLDKFLDSTPVFHHFTISDPIFSEHLSSIISNLGELGNEWFSTLLHSFLSLTETSNDRYLMKSITSIILHDPINLMSDYLQYVKEQNSHRKHLALTSFIISSGHILDNSFDLFDFAKASIGILSHPENCNSTEIDSAFQILSLKTKSFYLQVDSAGQESLNLTLNKKKPDQSMDLIDFGDDDLSNNNNNNMNNNNNSNEHISVVIKVSTFKVRPTIFLLDLPLMFSEPQADDGSLTLAAKFKSLAARINTYPEKTPVVMAMFVKYYKKKFDNIVSAVIQGISECVVTLINNADRNLLLPLLESAIFTPPMNWFHAADILSVVENIPIRFINQLFGPSGFDRIVKMLIDLSLSKNEQVSSRSAKVLLKMVTTDNFNNITLAIAMKFDVFDDFNLGHLLPVITSILDAFPKQNLSHLQYLVIQFIELQDLFSTNLTVLASIFQFIGCFWLGFVPYAILSPAFITALSIIAASIQCVSGFCSWENELPPETLDKMVEMIQTDLMSKNIDVNSENSLDYEEFLSPCVAALKFVHSIPSRRIKKSFILILYRKLRNIFPLNSALFVQKFWEVFSDQEKVQALMKMQKSLRFIQDYKSASILVRLFIQIYRDEFKSQLESCRKELLYFANYAIGHQRCTTKEQITIFKALIHFSSDSPELLPISLNEDEILNYCPEIHKIIFKSSNKTFIEFPDMMKPNLGDNAQVFRFVQIPSDMTIQLSPTDPCVKSQIKKMMRPFTPAELVAAFQHYVKIDDVMGIKLILQYCFTKSIQIDLKVYNFPEDALPIVIRYLRTTKSPDLVPFLTPFLDDETLPSAIYLAVTHASAVRYLKKIMENEKLTKTKLRNFATVVTTAQFPQNELALAVIHCIKNAKSEKKLRYAIIIAQNALTILRVYSPELVAAIMSVFEQRFNELPTFTASQVLNLLANKAPNEKLLGFAYQLRDFVSPCSPELYLIYMTIETVSAGDKIYAKQVPKTCGHLLIFHTPSIFVSGIMLFTHAQKKLAGDRLQSLMKHSYQRITHRLHMHSKTFPIPESSTIALINILTIPNFKKSVQSLISYLTTLIPLSSEAAFSSYYLALTSALSIVEEKSKLEESQTIALLQSKVNNMITPPGTAFLYKTLIKTIIARAEKMASKPKQENFVMLYMNNYMNMLQADSDFYDLASVICEWCTVVNMFNGFTQLLPVMSDYIFKNSPRFFPVFVGVAMFVKKFRVANINNPDLINKVNSSFIGSGKQMMLLHRARGVALQLLADPSKMKIALDLASFEEDCEGSDAILRMLK